MPVVKLSPRPAYRSLLTSLPPPRRRSWSNQVQKALVIGELLKMSDEFQSEQQRIKDEGNRKRAEAAEQGRVGRASVKAQEQTESLVVPMFVAPLKPEPPTQSSPSVITPTPPTPIISTPPTPLSVTAKPPVYAPPPKGFDPAAFAAA